MTLITQFKNANLSFVAGDGLLTTPFKNNKTQEIKPLYEENINKVYKCQNTIIGIYGDEDKDLLNWLNKTYNNYGEGEIVNKLIEFFCGLKQKYSSGINKPYSQGVNLIFSTEKVYFMFSTEYDNPIFLESPLENQSINSITKKEYFFSPQMKRNNEIDSGHQNLLESLFKQSFKEIYSKNYEKNDIQNNNDLHRLIELFYKKVYNDPNAHKNCIHSRVSYSVLANNVASEIKYIPFELPPEFQTKL